ncbi:hypothetical protein [Nocardiopsis sp. NRRL B-16309]|uniref:hypothetical protein n=1 Tax=Nocardiopsis sp. NRRL B-16309 TaxID=1519494 RepID=UPI001E411213|nr:hypothetical protein [Nocardiopsis sp. NRRL B-16309]
MDRPRQTEPFPRWPSRITRPEPAPDPAPALEPAPDPAPERHAPLVSLARQGWTVWFGRHTGQYWAAHTGRMRLVCADTQEELRHVALREPGTL